MAAELLQLILEAGSNLLEKARLDGWRDLSYADQMKIATDLLVGLEDNAFLLANVVTSEKILRKSVKNIRKWKCHSFMILHHSHVCVLRPTQHTR